MEKALPAIPAKRYFTIGEVSDLCGVKAYVLRYWEQEFTQLKPMKRRGNRRYYQHHEVLLIRRIRELLYDQGFTISGARNQLSDAARAHMHEQESVEAPAADADYHNQFCEAGESDASGAAYVRQLTGTFFDASNPDGSDRSATLPDAFDRGEAKTNAVPSAVEAVRSTSERHALPPVAVGTESN